MQQTARTLSRLRRSLVARVLSGVLLSAGLSFACTAQASLRPISLEQQQQLQKLAATGDTAGLRALIQTLENGYDTEVLPIFGVFRAILLSADDKSLQGLTELRKSLSLVKQAWEQSPNAQTAASYVFALDGQATLLDMQARGAEAGASLDLGHEVALKMLGPKDQQTQWLLYKRMYKAIAGSRYPLAQRLAKELQQSLPKPLNQCRQSICLALRFQMASLAGSMGQQTQALQIAKELMPHLDVDAQHASWNIYQLVNLSIGLNKSKELQQWCQQVRAMAAQPRFANLEGINRASARCLRSDNTGEQQLDALLEQERKTRGAGADGSAYLLLQKAELLSQKNHPLEAAQAAAQVWAIGVAKDVNYWQWQAHRTIAQSLIDMEQVSEAIYHAKQAVNVQQRMLSDKELTSSQREAVMQRGRELYEELAEWLLEGQRFSEAEQTLTLAREQSYHQLVRSYQPPQRALELTPAEQQRDAATLSLQSALRHSWQNRENNANALQQALAQAPQSLDTPMAQSQAPTDTGVKLKPLAPHQTEVRYLPAPDHVYVVVRQGQQPEQRVRLPIAQKQLTQDIAQLRRELQQRGSNPQLQAHKLYQQLWLPLSQWLPAPAPESAVGQAPEVRVHLEGALRYLPMAALHDGQHWLGESYALPQDTGVQAENNAQVAPEREGWSLQGSSRATADLPALPKVKEEIEGLARLANTQGIGHDTQQDDAFTADSLRHALQTRKVVHLASHFRLMPGNGQASGLYLGNGQLLTLGELNGPSFRFDGLDLLTLSACETAVPSGPAEQGLPIDSLAWLAQARGARHVLASLWAVADEGTQQFMTAFYTALSSPMDHAQAVRAAQLAMLKNASAVQPHSQLRGLSDQRSAQTSSTASSGLAHPYYWSAFVLLTAAQ